MIFNVTKLVYEFFVGGKIWAGLATVAVVGIGYLVFMFLEAQIAVTIIVGIAICGLILYLPKLFSSFGAIEHNKSNRYRRAVSRIIRHDLKKALEKLGGHRIFITEGHNGTSSLCDLAFLYMDITYLETKVPDDWINFEYRNLSVTIYQGFDYLAKHHTFAGSVDKLKTIDPRLAKIIKSNGTNYLIASCMYNGHSECIGTVILTFAEEPENPIGILSDFQRVVSHVECLIDKRLSLKEVEKIAEEL